MRVPVQCAYRCIACLVTQGRTNSRREAQAGGRWECGVDNVRKMPMLREDASICLYISIIYKSYILQCVCVMVKNISKFTKIVKEERNELEV